GAPSRMNWKRLLLGFTLLAGTAATAHAQQPIPVLPAAPPNANQSATPVPGPYTPSNVGNSPSFAPGNGASAGGGSGGQNFDPIGRDQPAQETPKPGPTPVREVGLITDTLGLRNIFGDSGLLIYGWL